MTLPVRRGRVCDRPLVPRAGPSPKRVHDRAGRPKARNASEELLAGYFRDRGRSVEYEAAVGSSRPDFLVTGPEGPVPSEVIAPQAAAELADHPLRVGSSDPYVQLQPMAAATSPTTTTPRGIRHTRSAPARRAPRTRGRPTSSLSRLSQAR